MAVLSRHQTLIQEETLLTETPIAMLGQHVTKTRYTIIILLYLEYQRKEQ